MDKKFCDNCGQEVWDKKWIELSLEGDHLYNREKVITCSYKCMEAWINRKRRHVSDKNTTKSGTNVSNKYYNVEIGIVDVDECIQEIVPFSDPWVVVKPEVFRERINNKINTE